MNNKRTINPNARKAMEQMKEELSRIDSQLPDTGLLSSPKKVYFGGYVGGTMTRRLVEMAEEQLVDKSE